MIPKRSNKEIEEMVDKAAERLAEILVMQLDQKKNSDQDKEQN
jgi:hypothetical protein